LRGKETVLHRLARIEGHGNFHLQLGMGVPRATFEVAEAPRFFEAILVGRRADEAPLISSRICGICSVSHTITALKAVEAALAIEPDRNTVLLRRLLHLGEVIQSHVLHLYFLGLPDYVDHRGAGAEGHLPDLGELKRALRLRRLGNLVCETIGGRATHPISATLRKFSQNPEDHDLRFLREELVGARLDAEESVHFFGDLPIPRFSRETEFVALKNESEYAFYGGKIASTRGWEIGPQRYSERLSEKIRANSTAKNCYTSAGTYTVGPLARLNLNHQLLCKRAKEAADALELPRPSTNPFHQHLARVVELVHLVEEGIRLIDLLLIRVESNAQSEVTRGNTGVGAVEAPRGLLLHDYTVGKGGAIERVNIVTPTSQNLASIDADLNAFLPCLDGLSESEVASRAQALIRAYDPCLSCSTH
jgi:coenzyme F420-reducing hydrogenase alpha subunit